MENRIFLRSALRKPARGGVKEIAVTDEPDQDVAFDDRQVPKAEGLHLLLEHHDRVVRSNRQKLPSHEVSRRARLAVDRKRTPLVSRSPRSERRRWGRMMRGGTRWRLGWMALGRIRRCSRVGV